MYKIKVDGGANAGFDDEGDEIQPLLSVRFKIPKDVDWQTVSFDLKDVIRHELEHLTQDGANLKGGTYSKNPKLVRPSKYMEDDQFIRDLIDAKLLQIRFANIVSIPSLRAVRTNVVLRQPGRLLRSI